jgi:AcrR family transcriptional regulator
MITTRRERKKEKTRRALIECAVGLFKEKGFTATSIDEITAKADVSRGTLYNYFPDKESILVGYFQNRIASASQELYARLPTAGNIREQLHILLDFMFQILADDLDLAGIYFRYRLQNLGDPAQNSRRSGMESLVTDIVQKAQERREIRADLDATLIARDLQFLATSFFTRDAPGDESDPENLDRAQIIELFLNGAGQK